MRSWSKRSYLPWVASLALALLSPAASLAQDPGDVSTNVAPPEMPVYDQPPIPADGYLWVPGYWAWSDDAQDYYWVPGTWVPAPQPGYLWTPGYWGAEGAVFLWHPGYWGPQVGFYGGVNYGYGYGGNGYDGGYWQGGRLYYNRTVTNITTTNITNVYTRNVISTGNRVSYNGGNGSRAQPTPAQMAAAHERHLGPTPAQRQQATTALNEPQSHLSQNQGRPPIAATARPGAFNGAGVVGARSGGTLSVVHQNPAPEAPPRGVPPAGSPRPRAPRESVQERPAPPPRDSYQERPAPPRDSYQERPAPPPRESIQERPAPPRPLETEPRAVAPRPAAPPPPHPAPDTHATPPRPAEHAPEH